MLEKLTSDEYSTILQIGDLRIDTVWDAAPDSTFDPNLTIVHSHPFYEVLISIGGVSLTLFHGETIVIPPGCLCLIPPGLYHSTLELSSQKSKRALRFVYEKAKITDDSEPLYERFHMLLSGKSAPITFSAADAHGVYALLTDCSQELSCRIPYAEINTRLRLSMFFIRLLRLLSEQSRPESTDVRSVHENSRRAKIETWIQQNYHNSITEHELATHMKLSERQLNRMLMKIYKSGFRELLVDLRMHSAAELLARTGKNVEEVAYEIGYRSLSGFYSAFRKYWGVSAIQYRKNSHTIHNKSDSKTPSSQT